VTQEKQWLSAKSEESEAGTWRVFAVQMAERWRMMEPKLIVMLTHHDRTHKEALDIFESCKDLPVQEWGFKDIGIPVPDMVRLVSAMKSAGKTTFLEVVTYTERECLSAARLAIECGFDYLSGTVFYPSVFEVLKGKRIKYYPFCGKVSGNPSVLEGSVPEIVAEAQHLEQIGVDGFDLLAYRYTGDVSSLLEAFVHSVKRPVIVAGSIDSYERLDMMKRLRPWGFTIGSAFFDGKFVKGGSFRQQVEAVLRYLGTGSID